MKTIAVKITEVGGRTQVWEYGVGNTGEGLWKFCPPGGWERSGWRQVLGTGQFRARTPREFMRRFRARFGWAFESARMVRGSAQW